MKKKFGLFGEPLFLGVIVGVIIACFACDSTEQLINGLEKITDQNGNSVLPPFLNGCAEERKFAGGIPAILGLGIKMGAVMELIPRITSLFIEGLKPIAEKTQEVVKKNLSQESQASLSKV